ncbi:transposase [Actinomadura sp. LD22]|uniref:Transposase n=1 Tax=Actinomadura physcomitrii TaxID=2650748 RepID=A0A6I4MTN5_9ACTN|nr:transposase [Actinomadura physcomitrii]
MQRRPACPTASPLPPRIAVTSAAAAKAKSQAKTKSAEQAIRTLTKHGEPITFQAIQREAGVSHTFLYGRPDLRGRIERLRTQTRPIPAPAPPADEQSTLVLALTSQIAQLKKQHRQEVQALRDALERAHGENLDLHRELDRRTEAPDSRPRRPTPADNVASIEGTS